VRRAPDERAASPITGASRRRKKAIGAATALAGTTRQASDASTRSHLSHEADCQSSSVSARIERARPGSPWCGRNPAPIPCPAVADCQGAAAAAERPNQRRRWRGGRAPRAAVSRNIASAPSSGASVHAADSTRERTTSPVKTIGANGTRSSLMSLKMMPIDTPSTGVVAERAISRSKSTAPAGS
jgi:hypothetical protein